MMEHEGAKATGRDRGRKRKLSGEQDEEGATSEQTASGSGVVAAAINIRTPETQDASVRLASIELGKHMHADVFKFCRL